MSNKSNDDAFVRELYDELDHRLDELQQQGTYVEKMTLSDAYIPLITTIVICFILILYIL